MAKLNLGCGYDIRKGFVNADMNDSIKGIDKKVDVNKEKLPWKDNTFEYVVMNSLLEYVDNPFKLLDEVHRVCKPDAIVDLKAPYYNSALSSFHKGYYVDLFNFTAKSKEPYMKTEYKVLSIHLIPTFWGKLILNIPIPKYLGLRHLVSTFIGNIIKQIEFKVKVIK